jgi:RNA polymerase sigma-70 factor (ECF subfamily)
MEFKYRTLVNLHQQRVYSLARHMLGDAAEAEDVCQEVYERLWKNIAKVTEEQARPWLLQVTRNRCIDVIRKRRDTQELPEGLACERAETNPGGQLARARLSDWLKQCIAKLKEPYQSLVLMSDLEQLSVKEMSAATALNENQVKVYLHRARKQLRSLLQKGDQAVEL